YAQRLGGTSFPWGTLAVNIIGCFFAGLLWAVYENHWQVSAETRLIVLVGFIGAFTTFSAFILDSGHIIKSSEWMLVAANIFLQNGLGIAFLFAGMFFGRMR
ncbi:fluoride efflux transporter FluC, partial [Candidatus Latescibacterota bacterium]